MTIMTTPSVNKLIEQGFIHTGLAARMRKTLPGRLAEVVSTILYHMDEGGTNNAKLKIDKSLFVNFAEEFVNGRPYPDIPGLDDKGHYCDTRKALWEIQHYLEACALREVTKPG